VLEAVDVFDGMDEGRACAIAAALERDSGHPIAAAFADEEEQLAVEELTLVAGQGLAGRVDGVDWRLGTAPFAAALADDGQLWLGDGTRAVARFSMREGLRPDAANTIRSLEALGLTVHLASGDGAAAVERMAATLRIADARARQRPEDKLALVRELQAQGRTVAMVGDGLNDAPVLAGADVSLAMGEGAALAQRAADLVLTAPQLMRVPAAVTLARRTRRIIRENFAWAVGYNLIALPLAAMGRVTPGWAAAGMALSSLVVTVNALRLMRRPREENRSWSSC
jgi:Cu2+-exporting ATPase